MKGFYVLFLVITLWLTACAPTTQMAKGNINQVEDERAWQLQESEKIFLKREAHINDLAWRIRTSGLALCPDQRTRQSGVILKDTSALSKSDWVIYKEIYASHKGLVVKHVIPGSPADLSGVVSGDALLAVNGMAIPDKKAMSVYQQVVERLASPDSTEKLVFDLEREGEALTLEIEPSLACAFGVILLPSDALNAYADGDNVFITAGMYRFAENDDELLTVLSHEFAHNSEKHISKKTGNYLLGSVLDVVAAAYGVDTQGLFGNAAAGLFSQDFEREADYVGMYYLAHTGIDTSVSNQFWRRMAIEHPDGIKEHYNSSHPSTAERWANLSAAHEEILEKIRLEAELVPERK